MPSQWTIEMQHPPISNSSKYESLAAKSPNNTEIGAYYRHIFEHFQGDLVGKSALVFGMDPEVRLMLHQAGIRVILVENCSEAIAQSTDWIPVEYASQEAILKADWTNFLENLPHPVDLVIGDGLFNHLLSVEAHIALFHRLSNALTHRGICVLRNLLTPANFPIDNYTAPVLIHRHLAGELDDAEFGFAMQIWGMRNIAFNESTLLLDNCIAFDAFRMMHQQELLTDAQMQAIDRYSLKESCLILPQFVWEVLLAKAGFQFRVSRLTGKDWYRYYRVYACTLR